MKKYKKRILITLGVILTAFVVVVLGYVGYMSYQYYRIEDNKIINTKNPQKEVASIDKTFQITTYNIGFGAYNHDFSFFMDRGEMKDGTSVSGKNSRAQSKEIVKVNTQGSIDITSSQNSDFYFYQEVDVDSTRSYNLNQRDQIRKEFDQYGSIFANNFHSAYLMYPFNEPHGSTNSGLLTLSKYKVDENIRRQFPVDNSFITKFTDLDRCFLMSRVPIDNGKELVLINTHMSAYDSGGKIRKKQLELLNQVLEDEYAKGNYVVVGGDFNHDIASSINTFESKQKVPAWVFELHEDDIDPNFNIVVADNSQVVATCRSSDMPYKKGSNYTAILDGFIISDNIEATATNIDNNFEYSDHNPVRMSFRLK